MAKILSSFWLIFRPIFVIFSLYLVGDAFYRWDGFSYYATFSEFLPSVALITILWNIVALFAAVLVCLSGSLLEWISDRTECKIRTEHLLMFICIFVCVGGGAWIGKRTIWEYAQTTVQMKLIVFMGVVSAAIFLTWLSRNKMSALQERITPLVWLFGIWVLISVPLVAWQTWGRQADTANAASREISAPSGADSSRPNIILVIFDTLTARDMSLYGYERPTTPFITEWAKTGSVFTRAQSASNFTSPSTASLITGKRVWTHQTYHIDGSRPVKADIESLPAVLKNNGYFNMAFIVNDHASVGKLGVSGSFDIADPAVDFFTSRNGLHETVWAFLSGLFDDKIRMYDWIIKRTAIMGRVIDEISFDSGKTSVPPEKAFNSLLEVIDSKPSAPFFAWIQLYPPHDPYLPPDPYMGMFDSSSEWRTFKSQLKAPVRKFGQEKQASIDILRARYDEFIRYCDKQFEDFIEQLKKRGKLKNTLIIFSSDHGESFEHNYVRHAGPALYEQLTHIPLVIKEPGQTEGRVINDLVAQIDIAPTILDLADIPVPAWMEGRSLVPLMRGKKIPPRPVFSMNFQRNRSLGHQIIKGSIAVWEGDDKLIHYLEKDESLLFNLKQDPDELNNLFDKDPQTGQRLLGVIYDNLKKANKKIRRSAYKSGF